MKCGLSNALIATLFGFSSRRQVARIIQQTRTALVRDFVPLHLGFSHLSRDTIVNDHTTDIAKQIFLKIQYLTQLSLLWIVHTCSFRKAQHIVFKGSHTPCIRTDPL